MPVDDRWSKLSMRDRADLIKIYTKHGVTDLNEIRKHYNSFQDPVFEDRSKPKADLYNRLVDEKDNRSIKIGDGVGTHLMSWATVDDKPVGYSQIQPDNNGNLKDYGDRALDRAIERGDTIQFKDEKDADWWTSNNYKQFYKKMIPAYDEYRREKLKEKYPFYNTEVMNVKANGGHLFQYGGPTLRLDDGQRNWLDYWYNNRSLQLKNNLKKYPLGQYGSDTDKINSLFISPNKYKKEMFKRADDVPIFDKRKLKNEDIVYLAEKLNVLPLLENYQYDKYNELGAFRQTYGKNPVIVINPGATETTPLHEYVHAMQSRRKGIDFETPQNIQPNAIRLKLDENKYNNKYIDDPQEIYSRLMELRYANKINPRHKWNKSELNEFKKNAKDFDILDRYDDDFLLYLFNDVAQNNDNVETSNYAANGGHLFQIGGYKGNDDGSTLLLDNSRSFRNGMSRFLKKVRDEVKSETNQEDWDLSTIKDSYEQIEPYAEKVGNFIPVVGTLQDVKAAIEDPTKENIGWAVASGVTDLASLVLPEIKLIKLAKAGKVAKGIKAGSAIVDVGTNTTQAVRQWDDKSDEDNKKSKSKNSQQYDMGQQNYVEYANGGHLGHITPYGQWQYPHEVTTIPSNNITMQGIDYPVVGISDTGDIKLMQPNENYKFNGSYVTEYPLLVGTK